MHPKPVSANSGHLKNLTPGHANFIDFRCSFTAVSSEDDVDYVISIHLITRACVFRFLGSSRLEELL